MRFFLGKFFVKFYAFIEMFDKGKKKIFGKAKKGFSHDLQTDNFPLFRFESESWLNGPQLEAWT